jgi:membrane-associated phospholipid phosphatase
MNAFDATILTWFNSFAQRWPALDKAVVFTASGMAAKGTFVALFLWLPYLDESPRWRRNREVVWTTVIAAFATLLLGIAVGKLMPFRLRPIENPALHFVLPAGQQPIQNWPSAFPSDHAILFAALATGCWFISRRCGAAAVTFSFLFIGLPRVYVGLHHPTDILGGAAMGIVGCALANQAAVRRRLSALPMRLDDRHPALAGVLLFFLAVQIASVFWEPRFLVSEVAKMLGFHLRILY